VALKATLENDNTLTWASAAPGRGTQREAEPLGELGLLSIDLFIHGSSLQYGGYAGELGLAKSLKHVRLVQLTLLYHTLT